LTCEDSQSTAANWNDRLLWTVPYVTTTGTGESAGRAVGKEFGATVGGEVTDRTELLEVVLTPDEWDRELVHKQERDGFSARLTEGRLTRSTPD
jgi:hypothetical protein